MSRLVRKKLRTNAKAAKKKVKIVFLHLPQLVKLTGRTTREINQKAEYSLNYSPLELFRLYNTIFLLHMHYKSVKNEPGKFMASSNNPKDNCSYQHHEQCSPFPCTA